jgi:hypothetical protein
MSTTIKKNKWKRLTIKRRHKYHLTFRGFSNVTSDVMENVSHELLFSPLCLKHFLISLLHSVVAFCPNIYTMGATYCLLRRFPKTHIPATMITPALISPSREEEALAKSLAWEKSLSFSSSSPWPEPFAGVSYLAAVILGTDVRK